MDDAESAKDTRSTADSARHGLRELFALALEPQEAPSKLPGEPFSDYRIICQLGIGASSVVYRASHEGLHRTVALKVMRDNFAPEVEVTRFWNAAAVHSRLDHPHIVKIFHVGGRGAEPFFTMQLIEGETLLEALPRLYGSPRLGALVLAKVASAVHYAHQQRVLHRDLKPANILLDMNDEPYVADFGLAKRLDALAIASPSLGLTGSLGYMAPEQAEGAEDLTPAADVYALGVILYELLTGALPTPPGSAAQALRWLASPYPPRPPGELNPHIDPNLETICLKCLNKDPAKRYASAGELQAALERACRPDAEREPLPPRLERFKAWTQRRARTWNGIRLALVALVSLGALAEWRHLERERVNRMMLETNATIASNLAGTVLGELRAYSDGLAEAAKDPAVVRILAEGQLVESALALRDVMGKFDHIALFNNDAYILGDWPPPRRFVYERSYEFREYVLGARALAQKHLAGAYVSGAFWSESPSRLVFAISAPVLDARGAPLGLISGTLTAKSVFGAVKLDGMSGGKRVTSALIGPRGPDRHTVVKGAPAFTFLVHPDLLDGREITLSSSLSTELRRAFGVSGPPGHQLQLVYAPPLQLEAYEDSLPSGEGTWLAAVAPVGKTGFAVIVQSRPE